MGFFWICFGGFENESRLNGKRARSWSYGGVFYMVRSAGGWYCLQRYLMNLHMRSFQL